MRGFAGGNGAAAKFQGASALRLARFNSWLRKVSLPKAPIS